MKYGDIPVNYLLPNNVISQIQNIIDINIIKYEIKFKKIDKIIYILFYCTGYTRVLNINTRILHLKNKIINITEFDKIYDEIKHIELLVNSIKY